ncbi:hypothetical protein [Halomicrococcus sp. NG-SE-24]|uniref:hypothetical protein n=1 Tax=Halomicrococcus sp. NG-SE-24 TaxID=3436928 RepID=UPI003D97CC41
MPISIDTFESNSDLTEPSVTEQVVLHLAANSDKAYTRSEIAAAIDADANAVGSALSRLKTRGLVRHRDTYWAITDDTDRLRDTYDLHTLFENVASDETDDFDQNAWLADAKSVQSEDLSNDEPRNSDT